jgi:hypothetical protein
MVTNGAETENQCRPTSVVEARPGVRVCSVAAFESAAELRRRKRDAKDRPLHNGITSRDAAMPRLFHVAAHSRGASGFDRWQSCLRHLQDPPAGSHNDILQRLLRASGRLFVLSGVSLANEGYGCASESPPLLICHLGPPHETAACKDCHQDSIETLPAFTPGTNPSGRAYLVSYAFPNPPTSSVHLVAALVDQKGTQYLLRSVAGGG